METPGFLLYHGVAMPLRPDQPQALPPSPGGRVLVLARSAADADPVRAAFADAGIPCDVVTAHDGFAREIGRDTGLLAIVRAGLTAEDLERTAAVLRDLPEDQTVPVLLLTPPGIAGTGRAALSGLPKPIDRAIVLDMPPAPATLVSLGRSALETRARIAAGRRTEERLRKMEQDLREAREQMREADHRRDEFLAILAHELRNPLAPIRNAIEVLQLTGPKDPLMERQREVIERQVNTLARLLDDLLDVSRMARGYFEMTMQPVGLREVVAKAVEEARPLIDQNRHRIVVNETGGDLRVRGDFDRLVQIVGNLLSNSAQTTPKGGEITLETSKEGERALIRVRDNGPGIDPAAVHEVFDAFSTAPRPGGRAPEGLWLGLSLARTLTRLHGGTIEARSEGPGKGSEFVVMLPLLAEEKAETRREELPEDKLRRAGSHRVLVVDDVPDSADTLTTLLGVLGHEVRSAYDGRTALNVLRDFQPDMVILDIGMPGMDGYEVARMIRQDPASAGVKLVAMTGYGQEEDQKKAAEAGFDLHLTKPVALARLKKLMNELKPASRVPS